MAGWEKDGPWHRRARHATRRRHVWGASLLKRILRGAAMQALTARLLGLYLDLALRTTRWRVLGDEHLRPAIAGTPIIGAIWHEMLPMTPALWTYMRRHGAAGTPSVLASKHRDGRFIGLVVRRFGFHVLHGSSSKTGSARDISEKGGPASVRALLAILQSGQHVALTPDGPRGPRRRAAAGIAQIAALSGVSIQPVGAQTTRRMVLPTWDRMVVPLPFGRGVIVCGAPLPVPRRGWEAALPAIEAALNAAADQADAICRGERVA